LKSLSVPRKHRHAILPSMRTLIELFKMIYRKVFNSQHPKAEPNVSFHHATSLPNLLAPKNKGDVE
jgi:hypothetical protein